MSFGRNVRKTNVETQIVDDNAWKVNTIIIRKIMVDEKG